MPAGFLSSRPLGAAGIAVSPLSLGSWRTYERLPAETGVAILRAARDEGINFFDDARYDDETGTAPIRTGYSEVVFGELFRGAGLRRDEAVVANKLWWEFWPEQSRRGGTGRVAAADGVRSRRRDLRERAAAGHDRRRPRRRHGRVVAAGKARAWGLVNWAADLAGQAVEAAASLGAMPPCAIQLPYSVVRRSWVEDPVMSRALQTSGAGLIASFCLAGGVLTGKYRDGEAGGRAAGTLGDPRVAPAVAAAGELAGLAARLDTTAAAVALAFPFTNPAVTSVLFGATSAEQVRANCAVTGLLERLSQADLAQLQRIGRPESPG